MLEIVSVLAAGYCAGRPNGFHWNFEVGPSYVDVRTSNAQVLAGGHKHLTVGNPTINGWITPTFVTGFEVVWP